MDLGVNNTPYINQSQQSATSNGNDENTENFDVDMFLSNDVNEATKGNESDDYSSETEDDEGQEKSEDKSKKDDKTHTPLTTKSSKKTRTHSKGDSAKKSKGRTKRRIVSCLTCREENRKCDGKSPCTPCLKANKTCRLNRTKISIVKKQEQREGGEVEEEVEAEENSPVSKSPPNETTDTNLMSGTSPSQRIPSLMSQMIPQIVPTSSTPPSLPRMSKVMEGISPPTLPPIMPQALPPPSQPPLPSIVITAKASKFTARRTTPRDNANASLNETTSSPPQDLPPTTTSRTQHTPNLSGKVKFKNRAPRQKRNGSTKSETQNKTLEVTSKSDDNNDTHTDNPPTPSKSLFAYGYSNLNQDSDEETDYKPTKTTEGSTRGTKRSRSDLEEHSFEDDSDGETAEKQESRPRRQRKRSENVQRAIEEELMEGKKKEKSSKKNKKRKKIKKNSDEEDKLPEDGVLAIDRFLLKRYNTVTKQCEYLVQWNGFDVHRSAWIVKKDIFAADYLSEFEEEWTKICKRNAELGEKEYDVGEKVWVKLKGHQWWPAQIVVRKQISPDKNDFTVVFYGDNTFAFVNDYSTKDFLLEKFDENNATKYQKKANEKAVKQAVAMLHNEPE